MCTDKVTPGHNGAVFYALNCGSRPPLSCSVIFTAFLLVLRPPAIPTSCLDLTSSIAPKEMLAAQNSRRAYLQTKNHILDTHAHAHNTRTYTYTHTHTHIYTHKHRCTHTHTNTHTYIHTPQKGLEHGSSWMAHQRQQQSLPPSKPQNSPQPPHITSFGCR